MTISESILVALFTLTVVFGVLAVLFLIIRLFSVVINSFTTEKSNTSSTPTQNEALTTAIPQKNREMFSSGSLALKNVDEPTAAMIMAIVSDESGIPLSELCFKSIRLIEK